MSWWKCKASCNRHRTCTLVLRYWRWCLENNKLLRYEIVLPTVRTREQAKVRAKYVWLAYDPYFPRCNDVLMPVRQYCDNKAVSMYMKRTVVIPGEWSILRLGPAMGCSLLLGPTFMAFGFFGSSGSTIAGLSGDLFYHGSLTIFSRHPSCLATTT